jgi:Domain of unknown function (DUF1906)
MASRLTTPIFGIDSYGPAPVSVHHSVGSKFAARYLSHEPGKHITSTEYNDDKANDIGLIGVFEDAATNALRGYDQGKADAEYAEAQAKAAGMPDGRPIYFAVDTDTTGESVSAYFDGAAAVLGRNRVGPYGSFTVVAYLMDKGFSWAWQTYAWSGGQVFGRAQVLQYSNGHTVGGIGVDFDHAFYDDYGQWDYTPPVPVQPHHYEQFYDKVFEYKGVKFNERLMIIEYDKLIQHPKLHAKRLKELKRHITLDMERIASKASKHREPGKVLPEEWTPFRRGERYKAMAPRSKGHVVK